MDNNVNSVAISSNGTYLIAGYEKNKISFFENSSSVPLWSYQTGYAVSKVAISSDGNNIVAGTYSPDNSVYFLSRVELFEDGNGDRLTISLGNIYILHILIIVISLVYLRKYLIRKQV